MSHIRRTLLLAVLLLTLGLAVAPGPSSSRTIYSCGHIQRGSGATQAEAVANALATLRANYYVGSYTINYSFCLTGEDAEEVPESMQCLAELSACVFPRPHLPW
jgi:hypothetical protein